MLKELCIFEEVCRLMGFGGEIGWFYAAKSETFAEQSAN